MKSFDTKYKKIYQIIGLMILCIVLILLAYNFTLSWFMDESTTSSNPSNTVVGTIDMELTTNFDFYNLVLAPDTIYTTDQDGQDIGTYIRTADSSAGGDHDVGGVYVRIKPTITKKGVDCDEFSLYFSSDRITTSSPSSTYTDNDSNMWVYNASDGYYYYLGVVGSTNVPFNTGYKTNNSFTNAIAGDEVNIRFEIYAIQRPYGAYKTWTSAPTLFSTFAATDSGV